MNKKYHDGFTLIELMLACALLSILMLTMFGFLNFNINFLYFFNDSSDEYFQARKAEAMIIEEVRSFGVVELTGDCTGIVAVTTPSGLDVSSISYGGINTYILSTAGNSSFKYYLSGGTLRSKEGGTIAEGIKSIQLKDSYKGLTDLFIINITMNSKESNREYVLSRVVRKSIN